MSYTISTATDLSVVIGTTWHLGVLVPAPLATVEAPVPMAWPPGAAAGTHRLAARVLHRGAAVVQQGHDVGPGVVHVTAPPDPFACAKHTLASSRTVVVGFARVRVGGQPVGLVRLVGSPAAAMSCCADPVAMAIGDAPTNRLNSVCVGSAAVDPSAGHWGTPLSLTIAAPSLG